MTPGGIVLHSCRTVLAVSRDPLKLPPKLIRAIETIAGAELNEQLAELRSALESLQPSKPSPKPDLQFHVEELRQQLLELRTGSKRLRRRLDGLSGRLRLQLEVSRQQCLGLQDRQLSREQVAGQAAGAHIEALVRRTQSVVVALSNVSKSVEAVGRRFVSANQKLKERFLKYQEQVNAPAAVSEEAGESQWTLEQLAQLLFRHQADRFFLKPGREPHLRASGQAFSLKAPCLTPAEFFRMMMRSLEPGQREELLTRRRLCLLKQHKSLSYRQHLFCSGNGPSLFLEKLPPAAEPLPLPDGSQQWLAQLSGLILVCAGSVERRKAVACSLVQSINQQRRARILLVETEVTCQWLEAQSQLMQLQRGQDIHCLADLERLRPDVVYLDRFDETERSLIVHLAGQQILLIACCPEDGIMEALEPFLTSHAAELAISLRAVIALRDTDGYQLLQNDASLEGALARVDRAAIRAHLEPPPESGEEFPDGPVFGWS